jgi:acyl transferase domain-containing protein/acyl carrier protein
LNQTRFAHPAVFVIEYALARLLMKWGLQPQAMIGHSLGEYVAACLAGVFSLEDALRLVAARALLIEGLPRGTMLAVALSEEESKAYLGPGVWLAATNGPRFCVLSGVEEEIEKVEGKLNELGVAASRLATRHAFHSEMMREIEAPFRSLLKEAQMREPRIPYVSNVTGKWIREEEARSADYWVEHLCGPVRFGEGVEELLSGSEKVMVEVGPGQSLSSFVKLHPECKAEQAALVMSSLRSEAEVEADERGLMRLIGKLWMAGAGIDWRGFYEGERRRRVPLPTYPFERQRYWIEPRKAAGELPAMPVVSAEPKAAIADALYLPVWKDVTENIGPSKDASTEFQTSWLVLLDEEGLGERLVARLRQANQSVTAVARGTAFNRDGADRYTINAGLSADYRALIKSLPSAPDKIIHLWNLEMNDGAGSALEGLESSQERSFHSLLWLAQALGDRHLSRTVELVVVSSQLHAVTGDERIYPAKATLLGPCRVIPYEYPQLTCRNVDLWPLPSNGEENERMAERLFTELNRSSAEPAVAYRGARRWVESFEPAQLPLPALGQVKWREGGVYLVTGGLGGIGLALAEYLARNWKAKLVLVGRSRLPERAEWPALLASEEEPSDLGRKLSKLLELEAAGIEALALSADVANLEQMEGVIRQARERFGAIHGVIHAAGVMGMGLMQLKSADQANDVLSPKVRGTLVLEQVLSGESVELMVLCSSVAAVMGGGPGQVDYCGANAFLDAYAERGRLNGPATVSINWGEWLWDAWQAGLEGFSQEIREYFKANRRRYGISFEEGQEALERIVSSGHRRVIVSTREFNRVVEESRVYTAGRMLEQLQESQQQQTIHPRPVLGSDYVEPRNEMERKITEIWQKLLGIEQVGVEDNFFELGGHSLLATQLFAKLRADFQVEISVRNLFEMATVARQAELVATMQWVVRGEAPDAFTDAESDPVEGEI